MSDETRARPSRALATSADDRSQGVAGDLVFVPPSPASEGDPAPDTERDRNGSAARDESEATRRRSGQRSTRREPVNRFVERADRFADAIDRFAGPPTPPNGRAAGSVFGEAFGLPSVDVEVDDRAQPFAPAAARARAGRRELVRDTDWPPIPTGLFPPTSVEEARIGRRPPPVAERVAESADRHDFAPPAGVTFESPAQQHAPPLVFSDARDVLDDDVFARLVSEPWRSSAAASAASRREIVVGSRSEIQSPALTVLFAIVVIAAVLLVVYLATPLLR